MKILIYNEQNTITNIYETQDIDIVQDLITDKTYKTFDDSNASIGVDIRHIREDGLVANDKELVELGLKTLLDGYEFDDNGYIKPIPKPIKEGDDTTPDVLIPQQ